MTVRVVLAVAMLAGCPAVDGYVELENDIWARPDPEERIDTGPTDVALTYTGDGEAFCSVPASAGIPEGQPSFTLNDGDTWGIYGICAPVGVLCEGESGANRDYWRTRVTWDLGCSGAGL